MQKIATRVFMGASVAFGLIGILMLWTGASNPGEMSALNVVLQKLLFTSVCVILPSLALSIAGKYLNNK